MHQLRAARFRLFELQAVGRGPMLVARAGVEPATFHFSGERYYQLSYLAMPATRTCGSDAKR